LKEFDFYHFGSIPTSEFGIRYFPLKNNYKDLNSARDLLIHHRIDAVFICPNWEETFCFVAYEALAAGCKVICNSESGNVIDAVGDNAIVYDPNSPLRTDVLKRLIIEGRNFDSCISEFVYSGTVASEFLK
jgi:glycosyltransferase involved in cell wall biosynthesis